MLDALEPAHPIIDAADLTPERFSALINAHRCLLARNLFSAADVALLRNAAFRTYGVYDRAMAAIRAGDPPPTDVGYITADGFGKSREELAGFRRFGSLVLGYCPFAMGVVSTVLSRNPIKACVEAHFGQAIGLSLNSSSVRLSEVSNDVRRVFHQDGSFLGGEDTETINCWIALDDCGVDAPGLEVFPQRIDELLPVGGPGAVTSWEIEESVAYGRLGADKAWLPTFKAGDAFVFDHLHLHRTHLTPAMTRDRFAAECWMFPIKERYRAEFLAWLG
ncbi:MAG: hypothetical protein ACOVVK_08785 [Elsteraceae bacterium]